MEGRKQKTILTTQDENVLIWIKTNSQENEEMQKEIKQQEEILGSSRFEDYVEQSTSSDSNESSTSSDSEGPPGRKRRKFNSEILELLRESNKISLRSVETLARMAEESARRSEQFDKYLEDNRAFQNKLLSLLEKLVNK